MSVYTVIKQSIKSRRTGVVFEMALTLKDKISRKLFYHFPLPRPRPRPRPIPGPLASGGITPCPPPPFAFSEP